MDGWRLLNNFTFGMGAYLREDAYSRVALIRNIKACKNEGKMIDEILPSYPLRFCLKIEPSQYDMILLLRMRIIIFNKIIN